MVKIQLGYSSVNKEKPVSRMAVMILLQCWVKKHLYYCWAWWGKKLRYMELLVD